MDLSSLFATLGAVAAGAGLPVALPRRLRQGHRSSRWARQRTVIVLLALAGSSSACGTDLVIEFVDGGVGGGGNGGGGGLGGGGGAGGFAGSGLAGAGGLAGAAGAAQAGSGGGALLDASVPADAGDASPDAAL